MPDADAAPPAANPPSAPQSSPIADKDRVGEEMADDARIWRVHDQIARTDDKDRIDTWNRGLDNLALFAGLFSAVTTAFIIEAQKDMKVDYAQLTFLALNATANGVPFVQQNFVVPSSARTITCLWVASLILSLSAALIAIMGKDWIGMYATRPVCNARQWVEMRTYRLLCVEHWYMSQVIASAPVLLHISLLLFGAGLVLFIPSDPLTHQLTLGLALAAGSLYLVTALSAVVFPASPFKSPATQMIRGALSASLRSARDILLYHSQRNLIAHVQVAISRIMAPDLNAVSRGQRSTLPTCLRRDVSLLNPPELERLSPRRIALSFLRRARDSAYTSPLSAWVVSRYFLIHASRQLSPENIVFRVRRLHLSFVFVGSPWTDVRSDRSPARLAKALSWLNNASLEPEVLRAIIIALGDLEIGGEVASLVSADLRTRVRADIRFNSRKVDFATLARYALADRNLSGDRDDCLISYGQFTGRFDMERDPHLRCEDGLAAVAMVYGYIAASTVRLYCPQVVSQRRMFDLLLPRITTLYRSYETLVALLGCYKEFLTDDNVRDLEASFLQSFDSGMREEYKQTVRDKFGGQSGPVELITYLIFERLDEGASTNTARDLILHILAHSSYSDHWCIAWLFQSDGCDSLWASRSLTDKEAYSMLDCLPLWTYHRYRWDKTDTPPDPERRHAVEPAVARTVVDLLSLERRNEPQGLTHVTYRGTRTEYGDLSARCIHVQLCHSSSLLTHGDKVTLVGHLLEKTALLWIRDSAPAPWNLLEHPHRPECCIDILAAIVHHLTPLLRSDDTCDRGLELFGLLVYSETHTKDGTLVSWDLGDYLREISGRISDEPYIPDLLEPPWERRPLPIAGPPVSRLLGELKALYPLCHDSEELLKHWNRIGLPGAVDDWTYETNDELIELLATRPPEVADEPARVDLVIPEYVEDAMWWLDACMM